jgi:hypothetical protein
MKVFYQLRGFPMTDLRIETKKPRQVYPLIEKAMIDEVKIIKLGILKTQNILKEFEKRFKQKTEVFYKKYQNGQINDTSDYMRWAGEYETLKKLREDFVQLKKVKICI